MCDLKAAITVEENVIKIEFAYPGGVKTTFTVTPERNGLTVSEDFVGIGGSVNTDHALGITCIDKTTAQIDSV